MLTRLVFGVVWMMVLKESRKYFPLFVNNLIHEDDDISRRCIERTKHVCLKYFSFMHADLIPIRQGDVLWCGRRY